jgi:hypothetical protein
MTVTEANLTSESNAPSHGQDVVLVAAGALAGLVEARTAAWFLVSASKGMPATVMGRMGRGALRSLKTLPLHVRVLWIVAAVVVFNFSLRFTYRLRTR